MEEPRHWFLQHIRRNDLCIKIEKKVTRIGRSQQWDFVSRNAHISRKHAAFIWTDKKLYVKDERSSNGIYVNCTKIEADKMIEIFPNNEVGLGLNSKMEEMYPNLKEDCNTDLSYVNLIFTVKWTPVLNSVLNNDLLPFRPDVDEPIAIETAEELRQILESQVENNNEQSISIKVALLQGIHNSKGDDECIVLADSQSQSFPEDSGTNTANDDNANTPICKKIEGNELRSTSEMCTTLRERTSHKGNDSKKNGASKMNDIDINLFQERPIKEECELETGNNYTVDDDYIIISDDDENYSQLMDGTVAPVGAIDEGEIGDNVFSAIKKEVEAYDAYDVPTLINNVCINDDGDSEDDAMSFSSWMDEDDSSINKNENKPDNEKSNENNNVPCNEKEKADEDMRWSSSMNEDDCINKDKSQPNKKDQYKNSKTHSKDKEKPSDIQNVDIVTNVNLFKDASKKRKSIEKESAIVKKIKTSTFYAKESSRKPQCSKSEIYNERRKKLREIAIKASDEVKLKTDIVKISAAKKVKVSESRGNFLIQNSDPIASTSKNGFIQPAKKMHIVKAVRRTIPIIAPHMEKNRMKKVSINDFKEIPPRIEVANYNRPIVPTENNNHHNIGYIGNSAIEETIQQMLSWDPFWFIEYKNQCSLPPEVCASPLQMMPKCFSSYAEYYNTVTPAMMMELWSFLIHEHGLKQPKNRKFWATLIKVRATPSQTILHYYTYINKEQNEENLHVKQDEILIVNYEQQVKNRVGYNYALGLVTKSTKYYLKPTDYIDKSFVDALGILPFAKLNFTIAISPQGGQILVGANMLRILASVVPPMRLFKSVKGLERSPLLNHILHPTTELYSVKLALANQAIYYTGELNMSQKKAVLEASYICQRRTPGIYLIQGPPGTGKTTVILNILEQILCMPKYNRHKCILILAPSNAAVDELVLRILQLKNSMIAQGGDLKMVRYGPQHMISSAVLKYSLHEMAKRNTYNELIANVSPNNQQKLKSIYKEIQHLKNLEEKGGGPSVKDKILSAIHKYEKTCKQVMNGYSSQCQKNEEKLLNGAEVICTTLSSCIRFEIANMFRKNPKRLGCCIVDEATQSNEQETLTPLKLGVSQLVLVGDPKQLPGVTQTKIVKDCGYGQSLFARIMSNFPNDLSNPVQLLNIQYRMHPAISSFPNQTFYNGRLQDSRSVCERPVKFKDLQPYIVFNLDMESTILSQEYVNKPEKFCVVKLLNVITNYYKDNVNYSIGIVTPYNNQKEEIYKQIQEIKYQPSITVNTVDSFQGQEKDIIIMSCVRENTNNFISDEQRLNVAMTRAKHALFIIGSSNLFATCNLFKRINDDALNRNLVRNVSLNTGEKKLLEYLLK